jgi:membrane protein
MRRTARRWLEFCLALAGRLREDLGLQTAGALTFTTLLALVPLAAVVLAVSSALPAFENAVVALSDFLAGQLLPEGGARVTEQIGAFAAQARHLTAVGLVFVAVTALMLMLTVEDALNRIFRVRRRRPLLRRLIAYAGLLSIGPLLIGTSLSMTSFLVGRSLGLLELDGLTHAAFALLTFLLTCAALAMLYLAVPYRHVAPRGALAGGVVAAILFELANRGFALYIAKFPTYTLIYGAFAAIPIFMLWLYLSWVVVLFGATLTAMLQEPSTTETAA